LTAQKHTTHAHEWLNIGLMWDRIDHFDDLLVEGFLAPQAMQPQAQPQKL
jgi:hypothetical protein